MILVPLFLFIGLTAGFIVKYKSGVHKSNRLFVVFYLILSLLYFSGDRKYSGYFLLFMIGFAAASISKRTKNSLEIKLRSALKRSKKPVRTKLEVLINVKNLISIIGENAKYLWEKQVSGSSLKNITDFLYEITVFQNVDKMLLMDPSLAGFLTNENVSAIHVNKTIVIFSLSEINLLTGRLVKKENADCIGIECIKVLSENILNLSENGSICDDEILANTFGKYKSWYL